MIFIHSPQLVFLCFAFGFQLGAQPVVRFPPASWTAFKLENSNASEFDWEDRNDTCLKGKKEAIIRGMQCAGRNCAFEE